VLKKTTLFILVAFALLLGAAGWALAAGEATAEAAAAAEGLPPNVKVAIALAAGFGISIAAFGGALGQSRGVASALDGIARNPAASGKIVTPMIIGLALIESLVIYSLVISFLLIGKL
jgi:F-type H+-transporting ATPase subunit c